MVSKYQRYLSLLLVVAMTMSWFAIPSSLHAQEEVITEAAETKTTTQAGADAVPKSSGIAANPPIDSRFIVPDHRSATLPVANNLNLTVEAAHIPNEDMSSVEIKFQQPDFKEIMISSVSAGTGAPGVSVKGVPAKYRVQMADSSYRSRFSNFQDFCRDQESGAWTDIPSTSTSEILSKMIFSFDRQGLLIEANATSKDRDVTVTAKGVRLGNPQYFRITLARNVRPNYQGYDNSNLELTSQPGRYYAPLIGKAEHVLACTEKPIAPSNELDPDDTTRLAYQLRGTYDGTEITEHGQEVNGKEVNIAVKAETLDPYTKADGTETTELALTGHPTVPTSVAINLEETPRNKPFKVTATFDGKSIDKELVISHNQTITFNFFSDPNKEPTVDVKDLDVRGKSLTPESPCGEKDEPDSYGPWLLSWIGLDNIGHTMCRAVYMIVGMATAVASYSVEFLILAAGLNAPARDSDE